MSQRTGPRARTRGAHTGARAGAPRVAADDCAKLRDLAEQVVTARQAVADAELRLNFAWLEVRETYGLRPGDRVHLGTGDVLPPESAIPAPDAPALG